MKYQILNCADQDVYLRLIQCALNHSEYVGLCTFRSLHKKDLTNSFHLFLEKVSPFEVESERFVTQRHYTKGQKYHIYRVCSAVRQLILEVPKLEAWRVPHYPEDISFYEHRGPWLYTITHERLAFLDTDSASLLADLSALGAEVMQL